MDQSGEEIRAAQIAVREATLSLLAAERRYHAAIGSRTHRLVDQSPREAAATAADPEDIHRAAAAYGAAAAGLREAYQHIRDVLKAHAGAG